MRCACVDIGSNTTRLLVADVAGALPREVLARKVHTHLGRALRAGEGTAAAAGVAAAVAEQVAAARTAGAQRLRVVATSALRESPAGEAICAAVRAAAGVAVDVLAGEEEAALAFLGATRTAPPAHGPGPGSADPAQSGARPATGWSRSTPDGGANLDHPQQEPRGTGEAVAVVDVGGGSTEIAVGPAGGTASWTVSLPLGSGRAAPAGGPPGPEALGALAEAARAALAAVSPPPAARALAVGGSAASLTRIAGPVLDATSIAAAVTVLTAAPAAEVAARTGLAVDRVRLLPAGLLVLAAVAERLGRPLELGCGGLREGVCLDLAGAAA